MPIHDWSRVFDGAFHDFHHVWIGELRNALNGGILPRDYYAMAEQVAGRAVPDVLTLQTVESTAEPWSSDSVTGATAVAAAPPRVRLSQIIEPESYASRQRSVVIHRVSDDRIVALIEVLSPGNKSSYKEFRSFLAKAVGSLERGHHLLLVDLHPRTTRDPEGIHAIVCTEFGGTAEANPPDKPLTLVSYDAGPPKTSYVEPVSVGEALTDMPLFLAPGGTLTCHWSRPTRPLIAVFRAGSASFSRRRRHVDVDSHHDTSHVSLSRLDLGRLFEPQLVDRLIAKNVLADLPGDGPRERLDDHDILRDFEMGDLTLAVLLELVGRARSRPT